MSLLTNDLVELVEKDDNGQSVEQRCNEVFTPDATYFLGWWLVKTNGREGWAPSNYLELVPPKPKAAPKPPPVAARRPPPTAPVAASVPAPKPKPTPVVHATSVVADVNAKPIAVFPGIAARHGGATPWKKPAAPDTSSASAAPKPAPALAPKPGPKPPVAVKPGIPKPAIAAKPPAPGPRPTNGGAPTAPPRPPIAGGGRVGVGQMDLAAAVSTLGVACPYVSQWRLHSQLAKRAQRAAEE